jgi:hypothetical protein
MPKMLVIQTAASIGACLGIVLTYGGLTGQVSAVAAIGFVLFAVSMLVTPVMRLLPKGTAAMS